MRRLVAAAIVAVSVLLASPADAVRQPPQPAPECVWHKSPRGWWGWLCPVTQDDVVGRSLR